MNNQKIIDFVKNILGCGCPDEVFETIIVNENYNLNQVLKISGRINIGNRLLIYLLYYFEDEKTSISNINDVIEIIKLGIADKDQNKFNRLRICINTRLLYNELEKLELEKEFNILKQKYDKIHLHFVSAEYIDLF